mmetsp:Transcript_3260/g.8435  ORF Transcript_3260/g.8435 Transcript_3260/m.8435 type:complete len:238 (+) Transcript_3260:1294-2007(+)
MAAMGVELAPRVAWQLGHWSSSSCAASLAAVSSGVGARALSQRDGHPRKANARLPPLSGRCAGLSDSRSSSKTCGASSRMAPASSGSFLYRRRNHSAVGAATCRESWLRISREPRTECTWQGRTSAARRQALAPLRRRPRARLARIPRRRARLRTVRLCLPTTTRQRRATAIRQQLRLPAGAVAALHVRRRRRPETLLQQRPRSRRRKPPPRVTPRRTFRRFRRVLAATFRNQRPTR